ncbi:hypothetical protein T8A63_15345 [Sulfitobacter sp. OXR-159]|uniref:hypothetical protein n=1 Tax=Sulfitobacter sp. OXR-159 TaxID=3100174 RepID=UPI002AC8B0C0|nr:hypothetical protein [Sulfitobacter sp. OXR-159]WPZ28988.1 hypothetical protein T8A63_15345 [Sulfitobacter sp. OXR-159]
MPRHTTLIISSTGWTEITNADVTSLTFQNISGEDLLVAGAPDADPPANEDGALIYQPMQGELNVAIDDLFPGISAVRLFAKTRKSVTKVTVSHA